MKINKATILTTALMLSLSSWSSAAEQTKPNQTKVLQKHADIFGNHEQLSVQFTQVIYRKLRNRTIERKGSAAFARPGKFYWMFENSTTGNEEYFYDGEKFTQYNSKERVLKKYGSASSLTAQLQDIIDMVLDGKKLLDRYDIKELTQEKDGFTAKLYPKKLDPSIDIEHLEVKISDQRKFIKEVKIIYKEDGDTTFKFKNPRTKEIPSDRFVFKKPDGISITEKQVQ